MKEWFSVKVVCRWLGVICQGSNGLWHTFDICTTENRECKCIRL